MSPKFRRSLILFHLWAAGLMAPAFILHGLSGGLYLMDLKGKAATERISLPADAALDFTAETLEDDVRALLSEASIAHEFEYIRNRGTVIQTRPTSRPYLEFKQTPQGLSASRVKPDTVRSMMELHKGHGPRIFKLYQKFVALLLILVALGGIVVGFAAKAYRRQTAVAVIGGLVVFFLAGFVL